MGLGTGSCLVVVRWPDGDLVMFLGCGLGLIWFAYLIVMIGSVSDVSLLNAYRYALNWRISGSGFCWVWGCVGYM